MRAARERYGPPASPFVKSLDLIPGLGSLLEFG